MGLSLFTETAEARSVRDGPARNLDLENPATNDARPTSTPQQPLKHTDHVDSLLIPC
jgi:hypothetical protein